MSKDACRDPADPNPGPDSRSGTRADAESGPSPDPAGLVHMDATKIVTVAQTLMASLEQDEDLADASILDVAIVAAVNIPEGMEPDFGKGTYFYRVASSSDYNYVRLGLFQSAVRACEEGEDLEEPDARDDQGG